MQIHDFILIFSMTVKQKTFLSENLMRRQGMSLYILTASIDKKQTK